LYGVLAINSFYFFNEDEYQDDENPDSGKNQEGVILEPNYKQIEYSVQYDGEHKSCE